MILQRVQAFRETATRFGADRRAVSALEFALIFPVMLLLYVGGFETTQLLSANRRIAHVASTVGDLVAQVNAMNATDMSNVFDASTAIMLPFSTSNLKMTVSSVLYKADGTKTVSWSKTRNGTAWTVGAAPPVTIPTSLLVAGQEVVIAKVNYTYTSAFTNFTKDLWGSNLVNMEEVVFFRPRVSSAITFN